LGLDLVESGFDFFGGGGISDFNQETNANYKGNVYDLAKAKGYTVAVGKDEIRSLNKSASKVIAISSLASSMPKAIDQKDGDLTLAEITALGIQKLDNPNGFFMMVEGGQIDWDGHANRSAENLREVLAFDDAVKVAVDFAKNHPTETLIVVTGDHETGGMTMGLSGAALKLERLINQKCSSDVFAGILKKEKETNANYSFETVKQLITQYYGLQWDVDKGDMNVSKDQMALIEKGFNNGKIPEYLRRIMNTKAGVGWTSGNHTALPVLTTATGVNSDVFCGFIENIDIANKLKPMM
jgi:alkaline phosphatase